jgi:hypothetical protein
LDVISTPVIASAQPLQFIADACADASGLWFIDRGADDLIATQLDTQPVSLASAARQVLAGNIDTPFLLADQEHRPALLKAIDDGFF